MSTAITVRSNVPRRRRANTQQKLQNQSPQRKTQNQPRQRRRARPRNPQPLRLHLSPCAQAYARAKLDPFSYLSNTFPCIPDTLEVTSYKFSVLTRGSFAIGTAGFGFVTAGAQIWSNDNTHTISSNATWAGTSIDNNLLTPGILGTAQPKFPFPSTSPRSYRTVASGLRVRYTGTELNRGGTIISVANNNHSPMLGQNFVALEANPAATLYANNRQWIGNSWNSSLANDYSYQNTGDNTLGGVVANTGNMSHIVMVNGTPGNTFDFEVQTFYEAIPFVDGSLTVNSVPTETRSDSDPVGYGVVKDFLGKLASSDIGTATYNKFITFATTGAAARMSSYFSGGGSNPTIEW